MRLKTSEKFYVRKSQISEPKSKHFIIFEGTKSEQIYFGSFIKKYDLITNIFFFLRDKDKEGWTNPEKIIGLLIDVINGNEKIVFTYETVFENIYEYISQFINTVTKKEIKNKYISFVKQQKIDFNDQVDINKLKIIILELIKYYVENYTVLDVIIDTKLLFDLIEENSTFDKNIDKIYLVVDRDKNSFTNKQYEIVLKKSKENNIYFYVINPCFEFWLLLHFKDCLDYSKEQLFENTYVTSNNTFVYEELKKYDPSYTKSRFNANIYMEKIEIAIENAKYYENDITLLKDNVGTNLMFLFDELKK